MMSWWKVHLKELLKLYNAEITTAADGSRMGVSPVQWNSWETVGVSMDLGLSNNQQTFQNASGNGNNAAVQGLLRWY